MTSKNKSLVVEKCPHCGDVMEYSMEQEDWVCRACGYQGLQPEDPAAYATPPGGFPVLGGNV